MFPVECVTHSIQMDFPWQIDTLSMDLSILYLKGPRLIEIFKFQYISAPPPWILFSYSYFW